MAADANCEKIYKYIMVFFVEKIEYFFCFTYYISD